MIFISLSLACSPTYVSGCVRNSLEEITHLFINFFFFCFFLRLVRANDRLRRRHQRRRRRPTSCSNTTTSWRRLFSQLFFNKNSYHTTTKACEGETYTNRLPPRNLYSFYFQKRPIFGREISSKSDATRRIFLYNFI